MTIKEYKEKYNISYRELARRLNISVVYLCDLRDKKRTTMNEKIGNKFKEIAPEIDLIKETKIVYKLKN